MAVPTADELRQQGNELYRSGKFEQALDLYRQAANAAPRDPAPKVNLSAVYLELGEYDKAIEACDEAISLHGHSPDKAAVRERLWTRKYKLCVYTQNYDDAAKAVTNLEPGPDTPKLQAVLKVASQNAIRVKDKKALQSRLTAQLPRFKNSTSPTPEYFTVGHDNPVSLIDRDLLSSAKPKYSILFGGVSDARHLYRSLMHACLSNTAPDTLFHFTINDHKPAVMARNIVILCLIGRSIRQLRTSFDDLMGSGYLQLLFFTYLAPTMPRMFYDLLMVVIGDAIGGLKDENELPPWLDVPHQHRASIIEVLQDWQDPYYQMFPSSEVLVEAAAERCRHKTSYDEQRLPAECRREEAFFVHTSMLLLPGEWRSMHGVELSRAYNDFDLKDPGKVLTPDLCQRLGASWTNNPTIFDYKFKTRSHPTHALAISYNDPFEWVHRAKSTGALKPGKKIGLFDYSWEWFFVVCDCMKNLWPRFRIEVSVGDITQFMDRVKDGVAEERGGDAPRQRLDANQAAIPANHQILQKPNDPLNDYPRIFDRIHLSNVPDYTGGSLPIFLYAVPLLEPGSNTWVTSVNLRNPQRFDSQAAYHREYTGLGVPEKLEQVFQVKKGRLSSKAEGMNLYTMNEYHEWSRSAPRQGLKDLMSQDKLAIWLFRLFLKLALPVERKPRAFDLLYSPLNMFVFIKL